MAILIKNFLLAYKSYFYIGAAIAIVVSSFLAGWTVNGWRKDVKIASIERDIQADRADANAMALEDMQKASKAIAEASKGYQLDISSLGRKLDKIQKEFNHEPPPPLPADCKPDDKRMRRLTDKIDAANEAIAGQ